MVWDARFLMWRVELRCVQGAPSTRRRDAKGKWKEIAPEHVEHVGHVEHAGCAAIEDIVLASVSDGCEEDDIERTIGQLGDAIPWRWRSMRSARIARGPTPMRDTPRWRGNSATD